jgi:hypothetical protein
MQSMDVRQAKDFLVTQTAEQARIEGVSFSDIERRMMYFTETPGECFEDPIVLNEEFEAQCDMNEYEKKTSQLMTSAYKRLKKDGGDAISQWQEAIKILKKGDHYILVLWS